MAIKLTNVRANPYERLEVAAASKNFFNEEDWRTSVANGTAEQYYTALSKVNDMDANDFYKTYNLYYGNPEMRLPALYNEAMRISNKESGKREVAYARKIPKFDSSGNYVYDENGQQVYETTTTGANVNGDPAMTDYEYNKRMISDSNALYSAREYQKQLEEQRQNNKNFLADINVILEQGRIASQRSIENMVSLGTAGIEQFFSDFSETALPYVYRDEKPFGDKDFAERLNYYETEVFNLSKDAQEELDQFAYNYSHFYDENGEMTDAGRWLTGISDTIGQMIPTMIVSYATAGFGSALAASSAGSTAVGSSAATFLTTHAGSIGQATFYASNVFAQGVSEDYENYVKQGMSVTSSQIISKNLIKTVFQWGVEKTLDGVLGATGIDNLFWGTSTKSNIYRFSGKKLTTNAFMRLGKDALQEGLEEALQDTSDFLVDKAYEVFVNENFGSTKWDWQNIADSFIIGALTSIVGSSARIVGTKRITTANLKTDSAGNLVKNKNGEYEFEKLGKIASYEYSLDLQSYAEAIDQIVEAGKKISEVYKAAENKNQVSKQLEKAMSQYAAAYYQAVGSFKLLSGVYGEIGAERFNKANEILSKIREMNDSGKFDEAKVKSSQEFIVSNLGITDAAAKVKALAKIQEANMTKVENTVEADEDVDEDNALNSKAKKLLDSLASDGINKVAITTDGNRPVIAENTLLIPKDLLGNGGDKVVMASIAEQELADELSEGVISKSKYFNNEVSIITDLYRQWTNNNEATSNDAIYALIFDTKFFEVVLAINERTTSSFVLRLNSIVNHITNKKTFKNTMIMTRIDQCRKRWIEAAFNYYSNNLEKDTSLFTKSLSSEERNNFNERLNKLLQLYNMGSQIISDINNVPEELWSFMERRIDGLDVDKDRKDTLKRDIRDNSAKTRQAALNYINVKYNGMFNTLYNGKIYMPKTSVANYAFNSWLETKGLTIETLFNDNYLNDDEIAYLGNNYTLDDLIALRVAQFEEIRPDMSFEVNSSGNIVVRSENSEDGFGLYKDVINQNLQAIETGESFEIGGKTVERKIVTDLKNFSRLIKNYLNSDIVKDGAHEWLTIDDIINHPEYLNDATIEDIKNQYGSLNKVSCYRYFQSQICSETDGKQSLIIKQDGTVVIGDMTAMSTVSNQTDIPEKGTFVISKFIRSKYLTGNLANAKVVLTKDGKTRYADYENVNGVIKFINTIYINTKVHNTQAARHFALLHEFQHAIQFENRLNLGTTGNILQYFSSKEKQEIINTVKELSPELFVGVTKPETTERFVENYIYHASGEFQAMGLGGIGQIGFYPVIVSRNNGTTKITFKNGKSFEIKASYSIIDVQNSVIDQSREVINKYYSKYNVEQDSVMNFMKKAKALQSLRSEFENRDKTKSDELLEMYYLFNSNKTQEEFENSKVIGIEINDKKYTLKSLSELDYLIAQIFKDARVTESKITINLFSYKPKDLKLFTPLNKNTISYSYGEIEIDKSYTSDRRNVLINLDNVAKEISEQNLLSEKVLDTEEYTFTDISAQELTEDSDKAFAEKEKAPVEAVKKTETTEANKISKAEDKVIDKRPKSERKSKFKYDSKKYDYSRTALGDSKNATRIVTSKDIDKDVSNTGISITPSKGGKYVYRKFVERRYYIRPDGTEGYKDIFDYYSLKEKRRHTIKSESEDTNIKYFTTEKGKSQITMSPGLREFVIASTDVELDPVIMSKIKKGNLTTNDLLNYVIETPEDKIDNTTFRLILKTIYGNDYIKSKAQLDDIAFNEIPKMAALYFVLKDTQFEEFLYKELKDGDLDKVWNFVSTQKNFAKELNRIYTGASSGLSHSLKTFDVNRISEYSPLDANVLTKESLYKTIKFYKGDIATGSKALVKARQAAFKDGLTVGMGYQASRFGEGSKYSLNKSIKEGTKTTFLESVTVDEDTPDADVTFDYDYNDMLRELTDVESDIGKKVFTVLAQKIMQEHNNDYTFTKMSLAKYMTNLANLSEEQVTSLYRRMLSDLDEESLSKLYFLAELPGFEDVVIESDYTREQKVKTTLNKVVNYGSKVQGIKRRLNTIRKYVTTTKGKNLLLSENSDILDENLNLKISSYRQKQGYKPIELINELSKRIATISEAAKAGVYSDKESYKAYLKKLERNQKSLEKIYKTITKEQSKGTIKGINISNEDGNIDIRIKGTAEVPKAIRQVLSVGLTKTGRSKIQELASYHERYNEDGSIDKVYDDKYLKLTMTDLLQKNAELLNGLSQDEAEEILEFYAGDNIILSDVDSQIVSETVRLVAAYLLGESRYPKEIQGEGFTIVSERFNFDESLIKRVEAKMMDQAHLSAAMLSNQRTIIKLLQPNKVIAQELAKNLGFKLDDVDEKNLDEMLTYVRTGNEKKYKEAKERFQSKLIKDYPKKSKQDIVDKLLTFERAMMLSNPGTWVRNVISNYIVEGGNVASYKIGKTVTDLVMKMFPKVKGKIDATQGYKLDTKASDKTVEFINKKFIDNGLLDDILVGVSKYDDLSKRESSSDNIVDMVARAIYKDITRNQIFTEGKKIANVDFGKLGNEVVKLVYKAINDDPWIKRATKKYLGQIIEEDYQKAEKLAKSKGKTLTYEQYLADDKTNMYGLSKNIVSAFVKAVDLASYDYMKTSNFITQMERAIRENVPKGAWFIYKQVFPFLASSWNWCVEGMRYTPLGLANAIIKLARLEHTVNVMDEARSKGKSVVSGEFAKYLQMRNIGKGTIGTLTFAIGLLLAGLGWAGIDDEDDEYKLFVGDIKININDVLGSQGIMLGIAIGHNIANEGKDIIDVFAEAFNQLFRDSIFQDFIDTFRYNTGFGDFMWTTMWDIPTQFWPNILKTIASIVHRRGVEYSDDKLVSKLQKLFVKNVPLPEQFVGANTKINPYTGETESFFSGEFFTDVFSRYTPVKVSYPKVDNNEAISIGLGIKKSQLTGNYTINGDSVRLSSDERTKLNTLYGKLNKSKLTKFYNNSLKVKVKMKNGTYKELTYSQMNDEQKKAAINNLMSNNSSLSKIYILTSTGKYKYYASESEYEELKKLGITKNIYIKTDNKSGFYKIN